MQGKLKLMLLVVFFALWAFPSISSAQPYCETCYWDYPTCEGVIHSRRCNIGCWCAAPSLTAYLDELHPGLFVQQQSGRLTVSGVVSGSPADELGIRAGDELVSVNGQRPSTPSCPADRWQAEDGREATHLVLRRANGEWNVAIPLVRLGSFLETAWIRTGLNQKLVEVREEHPSAFEGDQYMPYMIGIRWARRNNALLITSVLRGSPAYSTGLRSGDRIVAIDGVSVAVRDESPLSRLWGSEHRDQLELGVRRGEGRNTNMHKLVGKRLTEILRELIRSSDHSGADAAKAAGT
jgi:predicted metalloprotease with PDZ domain